RLDLADLVSEGRLPSTKETMYLIAGAFEESPESGSPGLNPVEKRNQIRYWEYCTVLVGREMQHGKSYREATKIVANNENISLANLKKHVTSKGFRPIPPSGVTVFGLPYNERDP